MAEVVGNWIFRPSLDSFIDDLYISVLDNIIPKVAEKAFNLVMDAWDNEKGYTNNGDLIKWARSPKSKRTNPILKDTGVLQSSIEIIFFDGGADFKFEASGGSIYKSGATVEEVSSYNDYNPHTNVPQEYMPGGSEWVRIVGADLSLKISDLQSQGKIY